MKISKAITIILFSTFSYSAIGQDPEGNVVEDVYDELTEEWQSYSDEIKHYRGLSEFCSNAEFRDRVFLVLKKLHHYDSLVLDIINDPLYTLEIDPKEYRQTLNEIYDLETRYSVKAFSVFLRESCHKRKDLEKEKDQLSNGIGMYSYDGQILMLETDLGKYLKHLDKKFISMRDHLHQIHPDQLKQIVDLVYND